MGLSQHGAGGAVGTAVFRGLIDADAQAGAAGGDEPALDAGPAGLRLNLHRDANAVGQGAPVCGQSSGRKEPRMTD